MELEYIRCNLCNSDDTEIAFKTKDYGLGNLGIEYHVVKCLSCGLCYVNPRPIEKELPNIYPEKFFSCSSLNPKKIKNINDAKYKIISRRNIGSFLDVGCMTGDFMAYMKSKGWDVHGLEISSEPTDRFKLGTIVRSKLEDSEFKPKTFDIITAWAVLEHMYDPLNFLKKSREVLKDDGELIALVTNINSMPSIVLKSDDIPRHLYMFSKDTIAKMFDEAGFRITRYFFNNRIFTLGNRRLLEYYFRRTFRMDMDKFFIDKYNFDVAKKKSIESIHRKIQQIGFYASVLRLLDSGTAWILDNLLMLTGNYGIMIVKAIKKV